MGYTLNTTVPPYAYGNVTVTVPPMGQNGYVYTSSGTNGTWANPGYAANNTAATLQQSGTLELNGKNADLKINGVSLSETLEGLQEMLGVMKMDSALEREFDELKQAGTQYRRLRDKFREQKAVWDTLKNQDL
jgi:hypothetical protein